MSEFLSSVTGRPMKRGTRPVRLSYKGLERVIDMPGWYCEASDEGVHVGDDGEISDRALAEMKVEADNLLSGAEIRRIRTSLRLTQKDAGEIIGGGPKAFQKYESGEIAPSRAIANALRLLERHPEDVSYLREISTGSAA